LEFGRRAQLAAQNMRERLIKGDDPETIQNDAYAALGLPGVQPVDIGTRKTSMFPREESEELFSLAPGQVSRVETETSRYAIYKVTDNRPIEEAKVQDQIVRAVGEEKVKAAFKSIGNSVKPEYNLIYFGSAQPLSSPH
jgi:parvulin-like peptidyl-prolyl isomerase